MKSIDSFELEDEEIYILVKNGTYRSFPMGFWDGVTGFDSAVKITKYVFEKVLKWSLNDIKTKATRSIFDEHKLSGMLSNVFDGSIYIAISEIYPELKEWADKQYETKEYVEHDHKRYLDDELIELLQEKAKEINKVPRTIDMHRPSSMIYTRRFGSWEKALIKARLIEDIYKGIDFQKYSKEVVIEHLKEVSINKERMLEKDEVYKLYPEGLIKEYFGYYQTLKRILENDYTKEELIEVLKKKRNRLGRIPSNKDIKFPKVIVFIDKFGSWQNAINEIGDS